MASVPRARHSFFHQIRHYTSNAFVTPIQDGAVRSPPDVHDSAARSQLDISLGGRLIAIKDNICTTDLPTTCASKVLGDFCSPYDATVVKMLRQAGATIVGKTNMDEFGMGSHSTNSRFGPVVSQSQSGAGEPLSAGGSSGGSAIAVRDGQVFAALGTDTGGSVRLPAAYTGTIGFKPSYGLISRYGVIAYANSLDTVGIFGRTTTAVRAVFDLLNQHDDQDPTSLSPNTRSRIGSLVSRPIFTSRTAQSRSATLRVGIPREYNIRELHPQVREAWAASIQRMQLLGHTMHPISLPATKQALSAYYVLAPAEACSNLAKYDGVRYGQRAGSIDDEEGYLYAKTRGEGFGEEVKRRILLGTYTLSAAAMDNYFIQAQKVRRLVQRDFDIVFRQANPLQPERQAANGADQVDFILTPTAPGPPPSLSSLKSTNALDAYTNDVFTVPASLAGLPSISLPSVSQEPESHSYGMQITGQFGSDSSVLDLAEEFQGTVSQSHA
ncbi:MAG: hypothetical protein Q9227_007088 [Pyrenula ochraceoflavens]